MSGRDVPTSHCPRCWWRVKRTRQVRMDRFNGVSDLRRLLVNCPQPCEQIVWTTWWSGYEGGISNAVWAVGI